MNRLKENHHRMISKEIERAPIYGRSLEKNRSRWCSCQRLLGYSAVANHPQMSVSDIKEVDFLFMVCVGSELAVSVVCILHSGAQQTKSWIHPQANNKILPT